MVLTMILITVAYTTIILMEVPRLVVQKMWRDLLAWAVLLIPAIIYSYGLALDFLLPNPTQIIEQLFGPLAVQLNQILGTTQ